MVGGGFISWELKKKARSLLDKESGTVTKDPGGRLRVCLVYPNSYYLGMSNLGLQTVYALLNSLDWCAAERAFLPDKADIEEFERTGTRLFSLETQSPLSDFDVLAFSVSFEEDYFNIPRLLALSGIPINSSERSNGGPIVMAGGCAVTLNPEPVADFMDFIFAGEAEGALERVFEFIWTSKAGGRRAGALVKELVHGLAGQVGVYVPSLYEFEFDGPLIASVTARGGAPKRVLRARGGGGAGSTAPPQTSVLTPETEFRGAHLVEVGRGCPRGCRFCGAGFIYLPPRNHDPEAVKDSVLAGAKRSGKVGLVGAAVGEYPDLKELLRIGISSGAEMTLSSLRLDTLDEELLMLLRESGYRTITLAPEAATERMRSVINKPMTEEELMEAVGLVARAGFKKVKLYFMVGLPTESDRDAAEIGPLALRIKSVMMDAMGNSCVLTLSINPFVPKPWTPFQWHPFESPGVIEKRLSYIRDSLRGVPGLRLRILSARVASMGAFLARGDRRAAGVITNTPALGWKRAIKLAGEGLQSSQSRSRGELETFPWDVIDHGLDKGYLWGEYQRGLKAQATPPCDVGTCTRCGVC